MSEREGVPDGVAIEEERLVESLRPHRPDATDFLRGVRERIDAGERARAESNRLPPWLRSAAALLPPGLLREEAIGIGAGAAAKPAGWGAAVLIAPAAAMLAVLATFVASLRALRGLGREPLVDVPRRRTIWLAPATTWAQLPVLVYLATMWLAPTLGLWVMAASMALFALVFSRLEREGLASRALVGGICAELLSLFALYTWMRRPGDERASELMPVVLALGALACALPRDRVGGRTWLSRYHVGFALFLLAWSVPPALHGVPSVGAVVRRIESPEPARSGIDPNGSSTSWMRYALTVGALERAGAAVDLSVAREGLHARLEALQPVDPFTRWSAAQLGLLRPEDWAAMVDDGSVRRDLAGQGAIPFVEQRALSLRAYEHAHGFTPSERARIVERLVASVSAQPEHGGLRIALAVTDALVEWGEDDALRESTPRVRAQLVGSFIGSYHDRPAAAFAAGPQIARDYPKPAAFLVIDDTLAALELIARVGAPAEIDLRRVARFLDEAAEDGPWWSVRQSWHLAAAAGLHELEQRGIAPARERAELVQFVRAVLPAFLLALFCLFATLRAVPAPRPAQACKGTAPPTGASDSSADQTTR